MDQDHGLALSLIEIAGPDHGNVDEFLAAPPFSEAGEQLGASQEVAGYRKFSNQLLPVGPSGPPIASGSLSKERPKNPKTPVRAHLTFPGTPGSPKHRRATVGRLRSEGHAGLEGRKRTSECLNLGPKPM